MHVNVSVNFMHVFVFYAATAFALVYTLANWRKRH